MSKLIAILVLMSCLPLTYANLALVEEVNGFVKWLEQYQDEIGKCLPIKNSQGYKLCDETLVDGVQLKKLFSMSEDQLVAFIKGEGIKVEIFCLEEKGNWPFTMYCTPRENKKSFEKITSLHGQYVPRDNTIFINEDVSKGSLIHEYIHYLQYENKNLYHGKRYKYERIELQKKLIDRMDEIIATVGQLQKKNEKKENVSPYLSEMVQVSTLMKNFSKWQDLLDERNIFQLYLLFGKEFDVEDADLQLAKKNMGFICARKDLEKIIPGTQCEKFVNPLHQSKFFKAIKEIIEEIRPKPLLSEVDDFVKGAPEISGKKSLEEKVKLINKYIFETLKLEADNSIMSRKQQDNILPDTVLKQKRGHCVGLTILYLLVGEKMGMDGYFVRIPDHVFPRFCEGKKCVNVETLKNGLITDDNYYIRNNYTTENLVKDTNYFNSENPDKLMKSSIYLSLGYIAANAKQDDLAEYFYKKSISNGRAFAEGYSNLAGIYASTGKRRMAKSYLKIALKINPKYSPGLLNLGILYAADGKDDKAKGYYDRAIKASPTLFQAYLKRAELYEKQKDIEAMNLDLEKALAVQPKLCVVVKKLIKSLKDEKKIGRYQESLSQIEKAKECISAGF